MIKDDFLAWPAIFKVRFGPSACRYLLWMKNVVVVPRFFMLRNHIPKEKIP